MRTIALAPLILLLAACGAGTSSSMPSMAPTGSTASAPAPPTASAMASTPTAAASTTAPETDDAAALLALIPDMLCGSPAHQRFTQTGAAAVPGDETGLEALHEIGMTGEPQKALAMSLATGCGVIIYRFPGADPARLRSVIEQAYFPGGPVSTTSVGDREVLVKDADGVVEYWFLEDDAMSTVVAPTADQAAEIVAALPTIP